MKKQICFESQNDEFKQRIFFFFGESSNRIVERQKQGGGMVSYCFVFSFRSENEKKDPIDIQNVPVCFRQDLL